MQIDPSLEEASIDLGASAATTFYKITLPMIRPAFFSGLAFAFVRCMTAISAVIFLVSARWNVATKAVLDEIEAGNLAHGAAYSIVIILIVLGALSLILAAVQRLGGGDVGTIQA